MLQAIRALFPSFPLPSYRPVFRPCRVFADEIRCLCLSFTIICRCGLPLRNALRRLGTPKHDSHRTDGRLSNDCRRLVSPLPFLASALLPPFLPSSLLSRFLPSSILSFALLHACRSRSRPLFLSLRFSSRIFTHTSLHHRYFLTYIPMGNFLFMKSVKMILPL